MPKKIKILITAGPTREYIDPVRYISNDSSGRMGFALAEAALKRGCKVTLISGPVALDAPKGVHRIDVISAQEMQREVMKHARRADIIIMAAAVADWRPLRTSRHKLKKSYDSTIVRWYDGKEVANERTDVRMDRCTIALIENPDILAELGKKKKPHQTLVGFALETENLERNARVKLTRKRCDWIVANSAASIGAKNSRAILLSLCGHKITLPYLPKKDIAKMILSHVIGSKQ